MKRTASPKTLPCSSSVQATGHDTKREIPGLWPREPFRSEGVNDSEEGDPTSPWSFIFVGFYSRPFCGTSSHGGDASGTRFVSSKCLGLRTTPKAKGMFFLTCSLRLSCICSQTYRCLVKNCSRRHSHLAHDTMRPDGQTDLSNPRTQNKCCMPKSETINTSQNYDKHWDIQAKRSRRHNL